MTSIDFKAPAELFLGCDHDTATAQGPRSFRTAAQAIRFALEEAAPVHLRGASLWIAGRRFSATELSWLYLSAGFPLRRKTPAARKKNASMLAANKRAAATMTL